MPSDKKLLRQLRKDTSGLDLLLLDEWGYTFNSHITNLKEIVEKSRHRKSITPSAVTKLKKINKIEFFGHN